MPRRIRSPRRPSPQQQQQSPRNNNQQNNEIRRPLIFDTINFASMGLRGNTNHLVSVEPQEPDFPIRAPPLRRSDGNRKRLRRSKRLKRLRSKHLSRINPFSFTY